MPLFKDTKPMREKKTKVKVKTIAKGMYCQVKVTFPTTSKDRMKEWKKIDLNDLKAIRKFTSHLNDDEKVSEDALFYTLKRLENAMDADVRDPAGPMLSFLNDLADSIEAEGYAELRDRLLEAAGLGVPYNVQIAVDEKALKAAKADAKIKEKARKVS